VKLDEISKILGLTGKPEGIDGSRVEAMFLDGRIDEVARYSESDVLNNYRLWLVYELFRGSITAKELDWSETQIREYVATRKSTNPHLRVRKLAVIGQVGEGLGNALEAELRRRMDAATERMAPKAIVDGRSTFVWGTSPALRESRAVNPTGYLPGALYDPRSSRAFCRTLPTSSCVIRRVSLMSRMAPPATAMPAIADATAGSGTSIIINTPGPSAAVLYIESSLPPPASTSFLTAS
jgi:hypothetical protein